VTDATTVNRRARKKRPGQPGFLVGTRFQPELLDQVDAWRRDQKDTPTRPEAIRRLVVKALDKS
jgi:hypothetical protein